MAYYLDLVFFFLSFLATPSLFHHFQLSLSLSLTVTVTELKVIQFGGHTA
jgi:hypothetical protein